MERATSFGTDVAAYELGRPEYVDEHVGWLLESVDGRVLDLAAGSGKLTRTLVRLGFDVVAVDPDAAMLAHNTAAPTLVGTADAIPLPDASVAAVTVGQAWHWFDPATAGPEITRVLVRGGRLGPWPLSAVQELIGCESRVGRMAWRVCGVGVDHGAPASRRGRSA